MSNIYSDRIGALRALMRSRGWDAVIITGDDPHGSEYPAERYKQVQWLTGFTGEAGDVVVTLDHAGLWTDTRYFIQAGVQLKDTGVVLHKMRVPEQVSIAEWLPTQLDSDSIIAVDGLCIGTSAIKEIQDAFAGSCPGVVSVPDLLSILWKDRPAIPQTPVITIEAGQSRIEKIDILRKSTGGTPLLLTALDDVAWTLNVRASDIEYNPLLISYLLITEDSVRLFAVKDSIEDPDTLAAFDTLEQDGVSVEPYEDVTSCADLDELQVDPATLNYHLSTLFTESGVMLYPAPSPVSALKAVKNEYEMEGMRNCHIRDGVAMERFLYWLEKSVKADRRISEWDASVMLGRLRSEDSLYRGDSFETISAYGSGAALPHYCTPKDGAPLLEPHGLYLCDSGGQYLDGTTDITRTVPLGECTALEREDYTLVLKGHIDLSKAVFPEGTPGCRLDVLAREPLWQAGRNFGHGTGHGVGFFLGVHEGPHELRQNLNSVAFKPGMMVTDEPGLYREGMHGVRHENLLLTESAGTTEFGSWLRFTSLTLCHFDTSALIIELLDRSEIEWLNAYNARVYDTLASLLDEPVAQWLRQKTMPI